MKQYDAFVSHASEDKDDIVRDLAIRLTAQGYRIWYDEFTLTVGDSLRRSIDKGISNSRFGIVVLSKAFFAKGWTNYELDGLIQINVDSPGVILPLWHGVSKAEIASYSPSLANIVAIQTRGKGTGETVKKLEEKLGEYEYFVNDNGTIQRSTAKAAVAPEVREQGVQIIFSDQTDRIINKVDSSCRSEIILYPLSLEFAEHPFHYWQVEKGNIQFVRHAIYEVNTGNIIDSQNTIRQNDGNKFFSMSTFTLTSKSPIRIVNEIATTNQFNGLFEDGMEYVEFNPRLTIGLFSYTMIMPSTAEFSKIDAYANDEKIDPAASPGHIVIKHSVRSLKPLEKLRYTFLNRRIRPDV
jgi:hypothetical protein